MPQQQQPFNLDDALNEPDTPPQKFNLDDALSEDDNGEAHGLEKAGNIIAGGYRSLKQNTLDTIRALVSPYGATRGPLAEKIKRNWAATAEAAPILGKDLLGFFDAFGKKQFEKVLNDVSAASGVTDWATATPGQIAAGPFKLASKTLSPLTKLSTYPELAAGITEMIARPMELLVGEDFSQDNKPLTPEERALRAKKLLGDVIMVAATHTTAGAIDRSLAGEAISTVAKKGVENATTEELLKAAAGPKVGAIGRRVISSAIGGGVGGVAGGLVANSGQDDALEAALINGVMGVPLGFAQEFAISSVQKLRGKLLTTPEEIASVAKSIADERELKIYATDSYEKATDKLQSLMESDNLSEAARKLGGEDLTPDLVDQIVYHQSKINDLQSELNVARKIVADNDPNDPNTLVDNLQKPDLAKRIPELEKEIESRSQLLENLKKAESTTPAIGRRTFDPEEFKQNFYHEFNVYAYGKSGIMDETPKTDFNFDRALYDFAKQKGIGPEYVPALRADIVKRMSDDFMESMEPDEKFAYNRMLDDLSSAQVKLAEDYTNEAARVARKAAEQGMYVGKDGEGNLVLKSRETGENILSAVDSRTLMDDFAKDAGRPRAEMKLADIGTTGVPDEAVPLTPESPPPALHGNLNAAFSPRRGRLESLFDDINMSRFGSGLTAVKDVFSSLDNRHRTTFVKDVWDKTQVAYRKAVAQLIPHHTYLKQLVHEGRTFSNQQWKQISEYRQSRTAKELVDRFTKTRGVSKLEQAQGQWLHDNDINIEKIFGYRRALKDLETKYGTEGGPEYENAKRELEASLGMGTKDLEAYTRFQTILSGSRNNSDLGAVVAYARALKSGMSKADYARRNNMSAQQLHVASKLDAFYDKLANELGIDDRRRLEDYMNHYRLYGEYPEIPALKDKTEQFLSDMPRTGEMADGTYEDHPIVAAMRYANAGIKTKNFYPVWNEAKASMIENLNKNFASDSERNHAEFLVSDYLEGIAGNRKFISEATLKHLSQTFKTMNVKATPEQIKAGVRRWTSNYFATTESAAQGFRPSQGIRDFYGTMTNHYIRFGAARVAKALRLFNSMSKEEVEALGMRGEIGTLQPYEVIVPGEQSAAWRGALARRAEVLADLSFKGSMQKAAYRNGHAMVYNEAKVTALEELGKLAEGKITKEQAYNKLSLHTYDPSIQLEFDKQVGAGQIQEASTYLARMTAAETVFMYGAANQARFMTGLPGALAGQFGVWPIWESRFLTRMMSRGSVKQRLGAGLRYTVTQGALRAADGLTGFNLSSWFLTPSAVLARQGPVLQAIYNTGDAMSANGRQQKTAANALANEATLLVPGYQAGRGWLQAYDLWNRGFDPVTVAGRGLGVSVDEQNNNWWDILLRDNLGFEQGRETIPTQILGSTTQKAPSPSGAKATNQQ